MEKIVHIDTLYRIKFYTKTKSPFIYYSFTYNKDRHRKSTKTSDLKEARKIAYQDYLDITSGKDIKLFDIDKEIKNFLQHCKQKNLKPNTLREYERILELWRKFFKAPIGAPFRHINKKDDIDKALYRHYLRTRPDLSPSTLNREVGCFIILLNYSGYKVNKKIKFQEKRRKVFITEDDMEKIFTWLKANRPYHYKIVRFIYLTGIRPKEYLKIKPEHILDDVILIPDRKNIEGKTGGIPFMNGVREIVEEFLSYKQEYVFMDKNGHMPSDIRRTLKQALKQVGIDKPFRLYDLRHLFVNRCHRKRIPSKAISICLGHSSSQMIDKHYGAFNIEMIKDIFL